MMNILPGMLLLLALCPALARGGADVSPMSIDFGDVGTSLVAYTPYERVIAVRNTSAEAVYVRARVAWPRVEAVNRTYVAVGTRYVYDTTAKRVEPGASVQVFYRLDLQGWVSQPFAEYRDTVHIEVQPVSGPGSEPERYGVPVRANIMEMDEPFVVVPQGLRYARCVCDFDSGEILGSAESVSFLILNPLGSRDTITVDSFAVVPVEGSISRGYFHDFLYTFDSIGMASTSERKPRVIPAKILPGMMGWFRVGIPWIRGTHRSLVRVYLHDGRGRRWVKEDTIAALVEDHGSPLAFGPGQEYWLVGPTVDVAQGFSSISFVKCGIPDSVPLRLNRIYFTGPSADALELHRWSGSGGPMPELPVQVECDNPVGYDVWVYRDRAAEGETIDTLWAEYYYDDPERGRVNETSARLVRVYVYPKTTGVADEEPAADPDGVRVIPNPVRDRLRVALPASLTGKGRGLRLYDLQGRDVLGRSVPFGPSGVVEIDVSGLPTGAYQGVIVGEDGGAAAVREVVVVR